MDTEQLVEALSSHDANRMNVARLLHDKQQRRRTNMLAIGAAMVLLAVVLSVTVRSVRISQHTPAPEPPAQGIMAEACPNDTLKQSLTRVRDWWGGSVVTGYLHLTGRTRSPDGYEIDYQARLTQVDTLSGARSRDRLAWIQMTPEARDRYSGPHSPGAMWASDGRFFGYIYHFRGAIGTILMPLPYVGDQVVFSRYACVNLATTPTTPFAGTVATLPGEKNSGLHAAKTGGLKAVRMEVIRQNLP